MSAYWFGFGMGALIAFLPAFWLGGTVRMEIHRKHCPRCKP